MAGRSAKILVEVVGDSRSVERMFQRLGRQSETGFQKVARNARVASFAIGGGLAVAAKVGFDELQESQQVSAQTAAALESTGKAANVTQKQIEALAKATSEKTGIDDEAIQASENMLLTFTKIRNELGKGNKIFDRATEAVNDLATRMNRGAIPSAEQLSTAAIRVGKALNDPIRGVTALRRVGVQFTQAQEDQIEALVKTGKTLDAQKIILAELNREFGGSAEAAGKTLPGQLAKARNAFQEMSGELAEALLPALTSFAQNIAKASKFLSEHRTLTKALVVAVAALAVVLGTVSVATRVAAAATVTWTAATKVATAAQWLLNVALTANPIGVVVVAVAALTAGIIVAYKRSERFRNILQAVWEWLRKVANAAVTAKNKIGDLLPDLPGGFGLSGIDVIRGAARSVGIGSDGGARDRRTRVDAPRGPRGPNAAGTMNITLEVDGKTLAGVVVNENQRRARQQTRSSRGRYGGQVLGGT